MSDGVSIIICCYNSAERLPTTLKYLAAQEISRKIDWEVIVIDNASTDNTAEVANNSWPQDSIFIPIRVIPESRPGLAYARETGISNARFKYLSFIDDDNWVCRTWVNTVYTIMTDHPDVGACGGFNEAVCEIIPPIWFEKVKGYYAIGQQATESGDVTETRGWLWGAGLTIRKAAIDNLYQNGFEPMLTGRSGKKLTAGEDNELCYALCMTGWRLWYDQRLILKHYLPSLRLNWDYLLRMGDGLGLTSVGLDAYKFSFPTLPNRLLGFFIHTWYWQVLYTVFRMICFSIRREVLHFGNKEGVYDDIIVTKFRGRYKELISQRLVYRENIDKIQTAPWRKNTEVKAIT